MLKFSSSLPDILFFWVSITVISFASGFIGGSVRPASEGATLPLIAAPGDARPMVRDERTRGGEEARTLPALVLSSVGKSMIALYRWKQQTPVVPLASYPSEELFVGYALVLTSDGWLVTSTPPKERPSALTAFDREGGVYAIETIVSDSAAGYTFIKITAKNLRAIEFTTFSDPFALEEGYLVSGWEEVRRMTVTPPRAGFVAVPQDLIRSTDTLGKLLNASDSFVSTCMPVTRDERTVIGCTAKEGIRSFRYLQRSLSELLRKGSIERPKVAIPYINLSTSLVPLHAILRSGALVNLPLAKSFRLSGPDGIQHILKNGDIIVSVNNEAVDRNRDLDELISQYAKGDTVTMRVVSGEHERDISFILY